MPDKIKIYREKQKNRLFVINSEYEKTSAKADFREKMLLNNNIKGIFSLNISIVDHDKIYEYDTEGLITLETLCKRENISAAKIRGILNGISETIIKGYEYMLDDMDYIINPEYLFINADGAPVLAYYPGYGCSFGIQIGNLAEYLMNRIDYHEQEAVLTTYTIYMKSREEGFGVRELQEFLINKTEEKEVIEKKFAVKNNSELVDLGLNGFDEGKKSGYLSWEEPEGYHSAESEIEIKKGILSFGKEFHIDIIITVVLTIVIIVAAYKLKLINGKDGKIDIMKTAAVLFAGAGISFYISRKVYEKIVLTGNKKSAKPDKKIEVDEATELLFDVNKVSKTKECVLVSDVYPQIEIRTFPFFIGKDEAHMDFCLKEPGISRYHMKVDIKNAEITVCDLNSTNGTYINNEKLEPNKPVTVSKGDEIRMGRCIYHVR